MVVAVMGMVATFFAIAALYMMLYATFLSIIQILVYAGAIMVLFVFVIMVLNRPEDEPWRRQGRARQGARRARHLVSVWSRSACTVWGTKTPTDGRCIAPAITAQGYEWGSTARRRPRASSRPSLFPFEAISILLLIAVVGAIAVARDRSTKDKADEGTP